MPRLRRVVETTAGVEAVAAFLSDFTTTEEWDPGTVACRRLGEAADAPVRVGSRFENVSSFRGRLTTLVYRVEELVEGERIRLVGENKTVTSVDDLCFERAGSGCRVRYEVDFRFKGLARLAVPFLRPALKRLADEGAVSMKRALDDLAPQAAGSRSG